MNITLNNNPARFTQERLTITQLLQERNFTFKMLVIKINGQLVRKTDYDTAEVKDGDEVSVLHLISGG
jgi:sulfur carrier protein